MRLVEGFQLRQIGQDYIAVPAGPAARRFNGLLTFNETGAFLFEALQREQDRPALLAALEETFDAPRDLLERDLKGFLTQMEELNLLEGDLP